MSKTTEDRGPVGEGPSSGNMAVFEENQRCIVERLEALERGRALSPSPQRLFTHDVSGRRLPKPEPRAAHWCDECNVSCGGHAWSCSRWPTKRDAAPAPCRCEESEHLRQSLTVANGLVALLRSKLTEANAERDAVRRMVSDLFVPSGARVSLPLDPADQAEPEPEPCRTEHPCPFKQSVQGDSVSLCDCDEDETGDCREDI